MNRLSLSAQESSPKYVHVTGRGNVDLKATARGEGADAILKSLNGKFGLNGGKRAEQLVPLMPVSTEV